jgi:hypothetical protein
LQYISKYASKSEPKSITFTEIFNQILNKSNSDKNSLAERDILAQKMCHLLFGIPLYHSSRQSVSLNLNEKTPRYLQGTGSRRNNDETTTIREVG